MYETYLSFIFKYIEGMDELDSTKLYIGERILFKLYSSLGFSKKTFQEIMNKRIEDFYER